MLAAGNFPRHRTICDFRAFHLKELSELFVQVVKLAREMGLVKLDTVAIDGTKVKANASRHKAMSFERMKQAEVELKAQIDALLARAKATDEAEVNEPEVDLPAEIERREARLAAIREARVRLQRLDQERAGVPAVQHARAAPGASRVEARVHGTESAAHGDDESGVSALAVPDRRSDWSLPLGGRLEGAPDHAGAPSWRGLGGAGHTAAG